MSKDTLWEFRAVLWLMFAFILSHDDRGGWMQLIALALAGVSIFMSLLHLVVDYYINRK